MAGKATLTTVESIVTTVVPRMAATRISRLRWSVRPRSVVEEGVAVFAPLVGQLGYRGHALVVVFLDLVEREVDPGGGAGAEGLGDVVLLARRLEPVLLEVGADPGENGHLAVDVGHCVGQPLLVELALDDAALVLAQEGLGDAPKALDLVGDRVGQRLELLVGARDAVGAHLALDSVGHVL